MKVKNIRLFFLLVLGVIMAVGCTPQSAGAEPAVGLGTQPVEVSPPASSGVEPVISLSTQPVEMSPPTGSGTAIPETMVFSLQTSVVDRRMVYVGVGGDIDGLVNPDLVVQPGASVHVTLINGDGIPHDVFFPDFSATSALVSSEGETSEVSFDVNEDQIGTYAYFCTRPGHRLSGQEGQLIVSEPE